VAGPSFERLDRELAHAADGFRSGAGPTALEHGRRVLAALIAHPDWDAQPALTRAGLLQEGGGMLLHLFKTTGARAPLDEAVSVLTVAANSLPDDEPFRADVLGNLGVALRNVAERDGDRDALDKAIGCQRLALATMPGTDQLLTETMSNLGASLRLRFALTGEVSALDEAVRWMEEALQGAPRLALVGNLAVALWERQGVTGSRGDLERGLQLAQQVVTATPDGHPAKPSRLNNLGLLFGPRFQRDGLPTDGDAALGALKACVDQGTPSDPDHGSRLANYANQFSAIFHQTAAIGAIESAEVLYAQAVAAGAREADVRAALDARVEYLTGEGLARRQAGRVLFARDLLDTLRRRELEAVGARLAGDSGLEHRAVQAGEHVSGTYRQRLSLASGRFAMLDDGMGFQLLPWTPALEQKLGQHITGVMAPGGGVDWSFGRKRGLGI
jgi:tetratricopeptide (TPR) repeat protein